MKQHAFPATIHDRLTIRYFRKSLPRDQRKQFAVSVADMMASEGDFATDLVTRNHLLVGSCVVCAYRRWLAIGLRKQAAKAKVGRSIANLSARSSRFLLRLIYLFSRDAFETTRRYTSEKIGAVYGPSFDIEFGEIEGGFVSIVNACGYRAFLCRHGVEELLGLFCEWDRVWIGALPDTIDFNRPSTIAQGAETCRFEFTRS